MDEWMLHEREIMSLFDMLDRFYILPSVFKREDFTKISYARYAIHEIINRLFDYWWMSPEEIVMDFEMEMIEASQKNKKCSFIFSIAAETAEEIYQEIQKGNI